MRQSRSLHLVLPSALAGALLVASLGGVARAQGGAVSVGHAIDQAAERAAPPPVRPARFNDGWEYRYYFCSVSDPCAADHAKEAYQTLNRLGAEGWEAYGYQSKAGEGFNWELKRRR